MKIIDINTWNRKQYYAHFYGQKEPVSRVLGSVPKMAFSKISEVNKELIINISVNVSHALTDGYHAGLFSEKFQEYLSL